MRLSLVAPTNTRPPAVTDGPALPLPPTARRPSGRASAVPSVLCQAISPVFAFTATSLDHGGRLHGSEPCVLPAASFSGALNEKYGPAPSTLARSYGVVAPWVPRP